MRRCSWFAWTGSDVVALLLAKRAFASGFCGAAVVGVVGVVSVVVGVGAVAVVALVLISADFIACQLDDFLA